MSEPLDLPPDFVAKGSDPRWRINNLYKIVDKNGSLVTFKENKLQQKVNEDTSKGIMILKARQLGFSTARIIRLLDYTIWTPNKTCVIIAHEDDSIKKLFRIVYRAIKYMPDAIRPTIDKGGGSKYEYFFPEMNSRIYCDLESRSDTIHKLHVSEIGLMKNDDRVRATVDAVPINGEITYESTPKGLNHFYKMWKDKNRTEKKFFFPWYCFDEYQLPSGKFTLTKEEKELVIKAKKLYGVKLTYKQIAFRRWKVTQKGSGTKGLSSFKEEYPEDDETCFLTSGDAVMNLVKIKELLEKCHDPIEIKNDIRIYKRFDKTKTYSAGADPAEGVGGDWSVGVLIENESRQVVAFCRGQWRPYDFANKLAEMCRMYTRSNGMAPLLGVERNNHGHAVLLQLDTHEKYPNLFRHEKNGESDPRPGWVTDKFSRSVMISDVITAIELESLIIKEEQILNECLNVVNNNGKIEAAEGYNDDCVLACAIALQLVLRFDTSDVYKDLRKKIRM